MKLELRRATVPTPGAGDARRAWGTRETLLVRLTDAAGRAGYGEASPLPGYSPDGLVEVEVALRALDAEAFSHILHPSRSTSQPPLQVLADAAALVGPHLPSARMALETAVLDLLGQRAAAPAPALLGAAPTATRALAELVGPAGAEALLATATRALEAGFRHLKIKLGAEGQLARELEGIARLRDACGPYVALRLDANGALQPADLQRAWQSLAPLEIEMIEEPGSVPPELRGVVPLALDESLQSRTPDEVRRLLDERRPRFIVLKPMALGGLTHCLQLVELARQHDVVPVWSHCFDGPWAWRATAALALALEAQTAHGLAPHAGLAAWRSPMPTVQACQLSSWSEPGLGLGAEPWP